MKTNQELQELKKEYEILIDKLKELTDEEIEKIAGGGDTDSLKFSGKPVPLPEAKSKKECDGGYTGKITPKSTDTTSGYIPLPSDEKLKP